MKHWMKLQIRWNFRMKSALNKHAPVVTKDVTTRKIKPWFNSSIKTQKRKMRCSEKLFGWLKTNEAWKVFDEDRKKYQAMLYASKTSSYSKEVKDCKGNTKKLYKLVYRLMETSQENLLPDNDNPEDLANEFADYFMNKISKIRDSLSDKPIYKLSGKTPNGITLKPMSEFRLFMQDEVWSIIFSMLTKSCETDVLPTGVLKKCIDEILPCLTRLVNVLLHDGIFVSTWKTSIIKPLLKKFGLELVNSSYRPSQ